MRTSRQGDVDGVCLAPPLRAPASVDSALPGWRVRDVVQPLGWGHDALTVCWRAPAGGRADAFPWADVPAGQAVDVLVQGSTLRWLGTQAGPIAPGDSATFFSHGALFGQAVTRAADSASRELLVHPVFPAHIDVTEDAPWLLPWLLRFCAAPAQGPSERLYRP